MSPADPTAVGRVADAVRAEILGGALVAGAPLREEPTAARFGVSRHTVRAAFRRLVSERLAEEEPYRGVRVAAFDRDRVIALQQLRAALEVEAVRIAGERYGTDWPDGVLAPARAALARLDALAARTEAGPAPRTAPAPPARSDAVRPEGADSGPPPEHGDSTDPEGDADDAWLAAELAHAEFHRALVEASASPRIVEAHAALGSELLLFLLHVRPHYSLTELADEHRTLLDDVQRRGPEAVREHLLHSLSLLLGEEPS